jgi:uncharacterized protein YcbX
MRALSEIYIYPIKSLGGIALQEAELEIRGLRYDRRWMLVDANGRFVSQREIPAMTGLGTAVHGDRLRIFVKNKPQDFLEIPLDEGILFKTRVEVWSDKCSALEYPLSVSEWFFDQLGMAVRLVNMPDTTRRRADGRYAPKGQYVSFADGFPYLIIGQASLDDLNQRLPEALPMNRFRPNFVFAGGDPYEEESWADFRIGNAHFRGVKPCGRCVVITTDQDTGARGAEPLRTLAQYRSVSNKVLFGQNVVWMGGEGVVRIGDSVVEGRGL